MELNGDMSDFEEAWRYYTQMEACGWQHLPRAGGLEDQDEMLMDNIFRISSSIEKCKRKPKNE